MTPLLKLIKLSNCDAIVCLINTLLRKSISVYRCCFIQGCNANINKEIFFNGKPVPLLLPDCKKTSLLVLTGHNSSLLELEFNQSIIDENFLGPNLSAFIFIFFLIVILVFQSYQNFTILFHWNWIPSWTSVLFHWFS